MHVGILWCVHESIFECVSTEVCRYLTILHMYVDEPFCLDEMLVHVLFFDYTGIISLKPHPSSDTGIYCQAYQNQFLILEVSIGKLGICLCESSSIYMNKLRQR